MTELHSIIVIDPEESIRNLLGDYFGGLGYQVRPAGSLNAGLDLILAGRGGVVLIDAGPSTEEAMEKIDRLRQANPDLRIIMITGFPTLDGVIEALRHGIFDVVVKPFRLGDLKETVQRALAPSDEFRTASELRKRVVFLENLLKENGISSAEARKVSSEPVNGESDLMPADDPQKTTC
jgi:DNA-binding NtrC family response regulator